MDQEYYDITLRVLIENVLKNKKLVALITIGTLIIAGIYTFIIASDVYESSVTIKVNQDQVNDSQILKDVTNVLDNLPLYSYLSIEGYKERIKSNDVLLAVIDELELDMMVENLAKKITISNIQNSNLITITISDKNPEVAAVIANSVADQFQKVQFEKSTEVLAEAALNVYKSKKATLTNKYEDNEFLLEEEIRKNKALIISLGEVLHGIDKTFVVDKSILEDTFTTQFSTSISDELSEIMKLKVSSEEVNPVYITTLEKVTNEKINLLSNQEALASLKNKYNYDVSDLSENIKIYEVLIDELKMEPVDRQIEEGDAFSDKLELTRVAIAAKISENNIVVVSHAMVPNYSAASNKMKSLFIGGFFGLMLGVFIALFKEYWNKSKPAV